MQMKKSASMDDDNDNDSALYMDDEDEDEYSTQKMVADMRHTLNKHLYPVRNSVLTQVIF